MGNNCNHYAWFVVVRVRPVPMEVHDVGMLQLREALEHLPDLILLGLVVLAFRELHLVPHHLHALFRVHGQVRAVDPGDISLLHLETTTTTTTVVTIEILYDEYDLFDYYNVRTRTSYARQFTFFI